MSGLESHYSANDIESRILEGLRAAGLDPDTRLSPEALGALDHFHTGGLQASIDLLELSQIGAKHRVLDIGAGLAGCARLLAAKTGCQVECLEMSGDYCAGATLLNQLTGLEQQINIRQGDALNLPYPENSFDIVWMQNVGMNIENKQKLFQEIARVLNPSGKYVFQDVAAGKNATCHFPLPWASDPADSYLISAAEMGALLKQSGFEDELFEDVSDALFSTNVANSTPSPAGQLGLAIFVENLAEKAGNARRSLEEGQVRYVRGIFRSTKND